MPVVVLDTDEASVLHRRQLEPACARHLMGNAVAITFVTPGELYKGMETRSCGRPTPVNDTWIATCCITDDVP